MTTYWVKIDYDIKPRTVTAAELPGFEHPPSSPIEFLGADLRDLEIQFRRDASPDFNGDTVSVDGELLDNIAFASATHGYWQVEGPTYWIFTDQLIWYFTCDIDDYFKVGSRHAPDDLQGDRISILDYDDYSKRDVSVSWTDWVWVKVIVDTSALFADAADSVNFNSLSPEQSSAAEEIAGGSGLYDALDGDDIVTLPNKAASVPGGYDQSNWFDGGAGDDTITGGDRNDRIDGGEDNDTIVGSRGNDRLKGGAGDDTFDYQKHGFKGWTSGTTQILDGGAETSHGPDNNQDADLIKLRGQPEDYIISTLVGSTWEGTTTRLTYKGAGGADFTLSTRDIGKVEFKGDLVSDKPLSRDKIVAEMTQLMIDAYDDGGAQQAAKRGWHPLSAIELGIKPSDFGSGTVEYTLDDGHYKAPSALLGDADALVLTRTVDGKRTLVIAFRGTDDLPQELIADVAFPFSEHYGRFEPLTKAVLAYAANPDNGIEQVIATGHSLGGAMVEKFLGEANAVPTEAFTWAGPGLITLPASLDDNVTFMHVGDPVGNITDLVGDGVSGGKVYIHRHDLNSNPLSKQFAHWRGHYKDSMTFLLDQAKKDGQVFDTDAFAACLRTGTPYLGTIHIEIGTNGKDKLEPVAEINHSLAGAGNDQITLRYAPTSARMIDGGDGIDTLIVFEVDPSVPAPSLKVALDGSAAASITFGGHEGDRIANIENVVGGSGDDAFAGDVEDNLLNGKAGVDTLRGSKGADTLIGGIGQDRLYGGSAADKFRYDSPNEGGDRIFDFGNGPDRLVFRSSAFRNVTEINDKTFFESKKGVATEASHRFIFETDTGILRFDPDGSGSKDAVVIATLSVKELSALDFDFV